MIGIAAASLLAFLSTSSAFAADSGTKWLDTLCQSDPIITSNIPNESSHIMPPLSKACPGAQWEDAAGVTWAENEKTLSKKLGTLSDTIFKYPWGGTVCKEDFWRYLHQATLDKWNGAYANENCIMELGKLGVISDGTQPVAWEQMTPPNELYKNRPTPYSELGKNKWFWFWAASRANAKTNSSQDGAKLSNCLDDLGKINFIKSNELIHPLFRYYLPSTTLSLLQDRYNKTKTACKLFKNAVEKRVSQPASPAQPSPEPSNLKADAEGFLNAAKEFERTAKALHIGEGVAVTKQKSVVVYAKANGKEALVQVPGKMVEDVEKWAELVAKNYTGSASVTSPPAPKPQPGNGPPQFSRDSRDPRPAPPDPNFNTRKKLFETSQEKNNFEKELSHIKKGKDGKYHYKDREFDDRGWKAAKENAHRQTSEALSAFQKATGTKGRKARAQTARVALEQFKRDATKSPDGTYTFKGKKYTDQERRDTERALRRQSEKEWTQYQSSRGETGAQRLFENQEKNLKKVRGASRDGKYFYIDGKAVPLANYQDYLNDAAGKKARAHTELIAAQKEAQKVEKKRKGIPTPMKKEDSSPDW